MIHVLSANTAHEVILSVPRLTPGAVHRAVVGHRRVGGKGVNVARACGRMGVPVRLVALADERGATELAGEPDLGGSSVEVVALAGDARTDVIVAEAGGRATVVNGVAPPVSAMAIEHLARALLREVGLDDLVVLAGSVPAGGAVDLYATLVDAVRTQGARTLVDASGPWLRAALPAGPDIVKVNLAELAEAVNMEPRDCWRGGGSLVPPLSTLVLSRGPRGARVWSGGRRCSVRVPTQVVVSAVGAGDAMTAGLACGIAAGMGLSAAVAQGAAWGAAAVRELDLTLDPDVARQIAIETRVVGCVPA
jgi:1-phosphofructokinase family hexose kinase